MLTRSARDSQLASFRQSVQQDLRSGTPIMATSGRESPFTSSSLLGNREAEVQRNIEMQRNVLMGQKDGSRTTTGGMLGYQEEASKRSEGV